MKNINNNRINNNNNNNGNRHSSTSTITIFKEDIYVTLKLWDVISRAKPEILQFSFCLTLSLSLSLSLSFFSILSEWRDRNVTSSSEHKDSLMNTL